MFTLSGLPAASLPRERLLNDGVQCLCDSDLLAVFLGSGTQGMSARCLAHNMLAEFGSFTAMLGADLHTLTRIEGIGIVRYCQLQAARELVRRSLLEELKKGPVFSEVALVRQYLALTLKDAEQELFAILLLDAQHQLICYRPMFYGTVNSAVVYPRELVKQALKHNAAAVILVHNHPSGVPEPSQADIHLTRDVVAAMALMDITVLDHFIVGANQIVSMSQRGLM